MAKGEEMSIRKSNEEMLRRNIETFEAFLSGAPWTTVAGDIGVTPKRVLLVNARIYRHD
jgi:hypothetical protein